LLQGARQVGKTWLINHFGRKEYADFVYLNFEQEPDLKSLFEGALQPAQIIDNIGLYLGKKISAEDTLICFDEIQIAPKAISSLKYFAEQAPEFHIIAAGSLLGVSVGKSIPFPMGKVNSMTLYPMSFEEYLDAAGESLLVAMLEQRLFSSPMPDLVHEKLLRHLKIYLYLGGMPEVVKDYLERADIQRVRLIQNEILEAYERDFSKYSEAGQAIKTLEIWKSVPAQLAREQKKFKYSQVRPNARASTFEQAIQWLAQAGLIHQVYHINAAKMPLAGYVQHNKFKVYMHDTGLLAALLRLSPDIIVKPGQIFSEYNGAFTENFVANQLTTHDFDPLYYWTSGNTAEVDFILQHNNELFPLEVKSGMNRNTKSLRSYEAKNKPRLLIRTSPRKAIQDGNFINLPLYGLAALKGLLA
jgi:predicted AAA+ superfamily ATPase